jgi:sarcosine oxidase, subunit beta
MSANGNLDFDAVVVGGGISGCTTALHLARGGMRVAVLEAGSLCRAASNANAGTLSMQIKRAALVPYSMRSWELWKTAPQWLGRDVGFTVQGGLTLAYDDEEAEMLEIRMGERRAAGAPIEFIGLERAQEIEPGLSSHARLIAYCPMDAFSDTLVIGHAYRAALAADGVAIHESSPVAGIERDGDGFAVATGESIIRTRRVVLAGGVWLGRMLAWFGHDVPVECGVDMVSVTESMPPIMRTVIGAASGLLTIKQKANGSVLIGGGWKGIGDIDMGGVEVIPGNLIGNLRLAHYTIPKLAEARVTRTWLGMDANMPDFMPLVGPVPGAEGAFVIGCIRGGYTIGPYMGWLLAEQILGREPEMPLFDMSRYVSDQPREKDKD